MRVIKAEFGACDRLFCEQPFNPMTTKALPLLTQVFYCLPVAHVRPVWRFLIPCGSKIPLEMKNACLGRIWRVFTWLFKIKTTARSEYYFGAG